MSLLGRMVESKRAPAVLRLDVLRIAARFPEHKLLVFEGVDDVGVYEAWIQRLRTGDWYRPVPGRGKKQLVLLHNELVTERSPLLQSIRFFVDHDYDGLNDSERTEFIFCTDRYSIENYLVDPSVVDRILTDELRCALDTISLDEGLAAYNDFLRSLLRATLEPMAIYRAGVLAGGRCVLKPEKLNVGLNISHRAVTVRLESWHQLISFDPPVDGGAIIGGQEVIGERRGHAHRGKWLLYAVRSWLSLAYEDRRGNANEIFSAKQRALGSSPDQLSMQALATRSPVPAGLQDFLAAA